MEQEVKKLNLKQLEEEETELKIELKYLNYLKICYEAKIERVEPLSEEFEDVIKAIQDTEEKILRSGIELTLIRCERETLKYKNKKACLVVLASNR